MGHHAEGSSFRTFCERMAKPGPIYMQILFIPHSQRNWQSMTVIDQHEDVSIQGWLCVFIGLCVSILSSKWGTETPHGCCHHHLLGISRVFLKEELLSCCNLVWTKIPPLALSQQKCSRSARRRGRETRRKAEDCEDIRFVFRVLKQRPFSKTIQYVFCSRQHIGCNTVQHFPTLCTLTPSKQ